MARMIIHQKKSRQSLTGRGRQSGVGLVEVLVALVISAFALLGFAGLQMASLRYQKIAHFRSLASQHSVDIADRIRANVEAAKDNRYRTNPGDSYLANTVAAACNTNCTPQQIAAQDIYNWRLALARNMTGGWGEISGDVANGFTITVYFKEPNKPKDAGATLDPNCRAGALNAANDKDVRCFKMVVMP